MNKIRKIFQSTVAKIISFTLIILFALSIFFFFDAYKRVYHAIQSYWIVYKGDEAFKNKELSKAIFFYEKGIRLNPKHYKAMYNLANIYVVYEDYYSAIENYKKALLVRPDFEIARIDYAIILSEVYRIDEAIEQYKIIIANNPKLIKIPFIMDGKKSHKYNVGVAYYNMGLAYKTKSMLAGPDKKIRNKYLREAESSYSEAVGILKSYNSNYNLGLTYQLLQDYNQAGYYYCKAMEKDPMQYEAHFNLAIILDSMKDYANANKEFKKASFILSSKGDIEKSRHIFHMLLSVGQKIAIINHNKEYYEKLNEFQNNEKKPKSKEQNSKIDNDGDDDELKSYSQCEAKERFMGGI